jgi:hypothetical protein
MEDRGNNAAEVVRRLSRQVMVEPEWLCRISTGKL